MCQVKLYAKGQEYWVSDLNGMEWQECQNPRRIMKKEMFYTVLWRWHVCQLWKELFAVLTLQGTPSLITVASALVCILVSCALHVTMEKFRVSGSFEESE